MASIIRIKRSTVSGNPATLGAGELAYSALTDNGSNGGDRLYIGMGTETSGNAANHVIIGGKYFTDMLDQTPGVLTASSALIVDSSKKLDELLVDNLSLNGNTLGVTGDLILSSTTGIVLNTSEFISGGSYGGNRLYLPTGGGATLQSGYEGGVTLRASTNNTDWATVNLASSGDLTIPGTIKTLSNGDLTLAPNGTGKLVLNNPYINGTSVTLAEYIQDISGGQILGGTGITVTYDDTAGTTTIAAQTITLGTTVLTNGSTSLSLAGLTSLGVAGNATVTGTLTLGSDLAINTNKFNVAAVSGNTTIAGTLGVTGATTLSSTLGVTSNATIGGTLGVTGATTLSSTLAVTSNATVGGTLGVTNDLSVNTNKFNVTAASGNTAIAGTLTVTGTSTFTGQSTHNGGISVNGNITLAANGNATVGGTLAVTGQATFNTLIDMTGKKITNLAEPTADSDAATKYYVDAARAGLDVKNSVKAATTANITLSNTQTIDGIALSVGDRVLVKDQTDPVQNGIYVVASGSWTRTTDADAPAELNPGTFVFVEQGTVNSDTGFVVTSDSVLTIGTDAINWTLFSSSGTLIAGNGLSKNGYTLEVNVANGIEIASDSVQLAASVAGAGLTYSAGVLDVVGTANRVTINANSIDIASTYVGQASITTLGTIATGTWNGSVIADTYISDTLTISGGSIDSTPVGATTRSTGAFTTLAVTNAATLSGNATVGGTLGVTGNVTLSANITGAGAGTSTLDGFNIDGGTY